MVTLKLSTDEYCHPERLSNDIAKQWEEFCQELGTVSDHVHYLCTLLDNEQPLPGDEYGLLFPE